MSCHLGESVHAIENRKIFDAHVQGMVQPSAQQRAKNEPNGQKSGSKGQPGQRQRPPTPPVGPNSDPPVGIQKPKCPTNQTGCKSRYRKHQPCPAKHQKWSANMEGRCHQQHDKTEPGPTRRTRSGRDKIGQCKGESRPRCKEAKPCQSFAGIAAHRD